MENRRKKNRITALVLISLLLLLVFTGSSFFDSERELPVTRKNVQAAVVPPELPRTLTFAGETVPLHRPEVREALDRELLIGTFFHSQTLLFLKKRKQFLPHVISILKEEHIPLDFQYLPFIESGYSNVVSPAGAAGYWQILEPTGKELGLEINDEIDERYHLEKATRAACTFLRESYEKFGTWTLAAASYNVGRRRLASELERQKSTTYFSTLLNDETARYVYRILATKLILEHPEKYGFNVNERDEYPAGELIELDVDTPVTHFSDFAALFGLDYRQLKYYNPWLRNHYLKNPGRKLYRISIPADVYKKTSE